MRNLDLTLRLAILLSFLYSSAVYSAEIMFPSGDVFLVEVTEESPSHVKFVYKNSVYLVPRHDLASYKPQINGKDVSFRVSKFVLRDGSSLQGVIVEEDEKSYTLRSELGFLSVSKEKIAQGPTPPGGNPDIPGRYLSSNSAKFQSKIGVSLVGMGSNRFSYPLAGFAIYYEPDGIVTPWNLKLGVRTEYATSQSVDLFSNFLYWRTYGSLFEWKTFLNIGMGASFTGYDSRYRNLSGVNPAIFLEYGSDIYELETGFIRASIRNITVIERSGIVFLPGVEISVGTFL